MYKVILILDKFFLKYERGVKLTSPLPPGKTTLKKPSLIRVKDFAWTWNTETFPMLCSIKGDFPHAAFDARGFYGCCTWGEILSILKKILLASNFYLVVTKTGNNHKQPKRQQTTANNHKLPEQIDVFRIPIKVFCKLEIWIWGRALQIVLKHRHLTWLCNLIDIYLTQLMTYWFISFLTKCLPWIRAPLA